MKHFLSGFSDADAEVILKHCREVLTSDGKILLLQVRAFGPPVFRRWSAKPCLQAVLPGCFTILNPQEPCSRRKTAVDARTGSGFRAWSTWPNSQLFLRADDCA